MENTLFKEWVYDNEYTPILSIIILIGPYANIEQLK